MARGRDRPRVECPFCTIADGVMCGASSRSSWRRQRNETRKAPAKRGAEREGDHCRKPCGQELWEQRSVLCPASCAGASLSFGEFVPADVRDAHLRLDQQGLIDVLNDRFVLRRSVAECAFLRLVGIGARHSAACRHNVANRMNRQRLEKASFQWSSGATKHE